MFWKMNKVIDEIVILLKENIKFVKKCGQCIFYEYKKFNINIYRKINMERIFFKFVRKILSKQEDFLK